MTFDPLPMLDTSSSLEEQVAAFVASDALAALLEIFGIEPPTGPLRDRLAHLCEASEVWDARRGSERDRIAGEGLGDAAGVVLDAADAFGLVATRPPNLPHYDHVVILGGLARACFTRPAEAARLLDDGVVTTDSVTALGGFRELSETERALARSLGFPHLEDEFDAMEAGVRSAFRLENSPLDDSGDDTEVMGASWRVRLLRVRPLPRVSLVAAPSSQPGVRRANTADTYAWFATRQAELDADSTLLLITSAIYAPYQHADAIRMLHLPHGSTVDTIGVTTVDVDLPLRKTFGPREYLQEVRSMLRAYRMLLDSLPS